MAVLEQGHGAPVVILNHDEPAFYAVPAEMYERLMDRLDDIELTEVKGTDLFFSFRSPRPLVGKTDACSAEKFFTKPFIPGQLSAL